MKNLTLRNIAAAVQGQYIGPEEALDTEITGAVTDSRAVQKGGLFIPVVGKRADGHRFIPDVFAQGAAAVLSERELREEELYGTGGSAVTDAGRKARPYILVKSSLQALKDIAEYYRSQLDIPVIGIAGSVGKTSTKEMIASVLSQKYNVLKTEGNFNNEVGMPLTLLKIRPEHEAAVIEMGISDFGEMHRLAKVARPDICVMTNIGQCHLEFLGDRDGVLRAKSEIFDFLRKDGAVVLNGNDDKLNTIGTPAGVQPMRYFVEDGSAERVMEPECYTVTAASVTSNGLEGMEADLICVDPAGTAATEGVLARAARRKAEENGTPVPDRKTASDSGSIDIIVRHISEPLPGIHNIYNACAAACVGLKLGLTLDEIVDGIGQARTIAGRSHMIHLDRNILVVDDCYNANPVSMEAALDVLSYAKGRTIAVLGDMGELGTGEKELHAQVGAYAASKEIDILYCAGELSREMARAAKEASGIPQDSDGHVENLADILAGRKRAKGSCGSVRHFDSKEELIQDLLQLVRRNDSILVKASHFMDYPKIVEALEEKFAVTEPNA